MYANERKTVTTQEQAEEEYPWHDPSELRPVWEKYGNAPDVASHFGISERIARKVLERHTDYEAKTYGSHLLDDLSPEDVGLSSSEDESEELATDGGRSTTPDAGGV